MEYTSATQENSLISEVAKYLVMSLDGIQGKDRTQEFTGYQPTKSVVRALTHAFIYYVTFK